MTAREVLDGIKDRGHSAGCAAHDDCLRANTARLTRAIEDVLEVSADPRVGVTAKALMRNAIEDALNPKEGQ